jgi:glucose/arabinose dehydrogenase
MCKTSLISALHREPLCIDASGDRRSAIRRQGGSEGQLDRATVSLVGKLCTEEAGQEMGEGTVGRDHRSLMAGAWRLAPSALGTHPSGTVGHIRRTGAVALVVATVAFGLIGVTARQAVSATGPVTITLTSAPSQVATLQAVAFRITVTNTGSAAATGMTLTDSMTGASSTGPYPVQLPNGPAITSNLGTCTFANPNETCAVPTIAAGQVWNVTMTVGVTAAAGTAYSDTATVSGTESSTAFSTPATTTSAVSPALAPGFTQTQLAGGLNKPIVLAFAANGDLYIGEQGGTILVYRNGAVQPTPVLTLTVFSQGETGLLGMALDPNFATNGYLYVSYTAALTTSTGTGQPYARLSRFTVANGVASPSSEKIYYTGNQVQNEDGSGGGYDHAGNDLKVGPDGKLWWSVGDNVPAISNGENLDNPYGKILRFNLDGSVPSDDPFVNVAGAVPYIYAYGLRNPWRFTFLPSGQAMAEDTGSSYWEDLDTIQAGGNYGWPLKEGNCGSCGFLNPAYSYGHYPTDAAASAIAAYSGSTFPKAYDNVVFFGDYTRQDIEAVTFDPTYRTETSDTVFDSKAGTIADLVEGPNGNLYFVSIFEGTVSEISATGPFPPTASATATPDAGSAPLAVQFSSASSSDPYGRTLTESWNFGDRSRPSTAADPTHTYLFPGTYTATLLVSNGSTASTTTTKVVVGPSPPVASISAPSTYDAGQTVSFSGSASDPIDGTLPGSDYVWQADYYANGVRQPSYFAEVADPYYGPTTGSSSGSITIPTDPSQVPGSFYRITLTVTDSRGLTTVVTKDLHPNLTTWSVSTNVPGTGYSVDGAWETGPVTVSGVTGVVHVLNGLPQAQTVGGVRYRFVGWADGSALTETITAGSGAGSYTAQYEPVVNSVPLPWTSTDVGAPITSGTADYSAADSSYYLDGGGADAFGANDQFHYVYQTLAGDGSITARVRYQSDASAWSKAGVMIKQSAAAGAPFVDALVTPDVSPATPNSNGVGCDANGCLSPLPPVAPAMGYGARMQYSGSGSKTPTTYPAGFTSPDKWVKLARSGNVFMTWISANGVNWTLMGTATVPMTGPVTIGLFDTSHNIGQDSTAAFDNVQVNAVTPPGPLPSPWIDTDVGAPIPAGSASYTNGVYTVNGSGTDIWGTSDQFNYVNQPATGSGTITARVTSQTNTSSNAKAGIIFKQSTTAGSPYLLIAVAPTGVVKVQYDFSGSLTESTYAFPNLWMKLSWTTAGRVTAYLSSDGVTWTQVLSKTLAVTSPATAGLFECSHKAGLTGTATFDNVSYTSP